jgi:hypothetical protein
MDYQHVRADVKTIDRAYFDAIHVFAFDASFGDDIGHSVLSFALRIRRFRPSQQILITGNKTFSYRMDDPHNTPAAYNQIQTSDCGRNSL